MSLSIEKFLRLPTLPTVAVEVIRLFDDPNSSMDQVTAVIRNDPAIAAKILKTANSAQYGGRGTVSDLKRAITLLGRNAVTPLVLSFSLCQQSVSSHENAVHFKQFWLRSFVQATAAEVIAAMFGSPALKGECYTTNLLAGVGKLAFLRAEPEKYQQILKRSCEEEVSLIALESETLGLNHFKLSSVLLGQIGLPARCVSAILSLAPNGRNAPTGSDQEQRLVLITRAANSVASLLCDFDQGVSIITLEETLEELNLPTEVSSEELLSLVQDRIDATAEMFDINPRNFPPATEILQDALDQLSRFSVVATQNPTASDIPSELLQENGRLKRRVADLLRLSSTDALTGAFNRGYFLQILAERTALHRVRREMLGLAVIDLDHFKRVNDTYGHQAGDAVLRQAADAIRDTLRDTDILARYGGEEFVVLMDNANIPGLHVVGERLRKALESAQVVWEGIQIPVTASVGLTAGHINNENEQDFASNLFAVADMAMYQAKHSGRNRFIVDSMERLPKATPATAETQHHSPVMATPAVHER